GALYGAFAVCFLVVARRFVCHEWAAWLALALALASPPVAATSWVVISFPQVVVPLLTCLALLSYWAWAERRRAYGLGALGLLLLAGPWVREILFVVPLLVGYLEWRRARRPTAVMGLAAVGLAHALFPTALLKGMFFPGLPLCSMFGFGGSVTQELAGEWLRWHAAAHFLPLLPPCAWGLALAAGLTRAAPSDPPAQGRLGRVAGAWGPAAAAGCAAVLAAFGSPFAAAVFTLVLPLLAVRLGQPFLAVWFGLLFAPLLRVFTEHIH